ncbi:iron ABC transporter permease [Paenibacillus sp. SC116]|uniref:FecCD family ABC transporter permease n=1 Tax=Paenibacillus sp. SC116 TaxID=2968986 RepID=UPI00215AD6BC|nr:iron ABC transporter permease [Paenibacillus sp. SC116]MCR8843559.1 iron ABC transporter permease [Paenibacillus sp. SC116]
MEHVKVTMESLERQRVKRSRMIMSMLAMLIFIVLIASMNTGYSRLSPLEVLSTLFGYGSDKQELILFEFRLPRIVISVWIGAGLAVSGCIMQGVSRNALADPGILGINAGAGLAIMLFLTFFPTTAAAPVFMLPLLAFIGAGLTAALIYVLAYKRYNGISPTRLLLTGIAVAAGISAAMIVLTVRLDPDKFQFLATWMAGSIWGTDWKHVWALLPWLLILLPYVFLKAQTMNILNLGYEPSLGLGIDMSREQLKLLAAAVALAASCVAVSGGIGFVGLIGPHLARRLVGPRHQFLLPVSALTGGLLIVVADTLGRSLLQPVEIPTGIITAVIGAPYFLYLMTRSKV